jgi:hypothetical protein
MTAANRKHDSNLTIQRAELDDYPTPRWAVHRLLDAIPFVPGGLWLEPSAGAGSVIAAVRSWHAERQREAPRFAALEIQERFRPELEALAIEQLHIGDALAWMAERATSDMHAGAHHVPFNVSVGNPPYTHALEFVQGALSVSNNVALLLRLDFMGSEDRSDWLREHAPTLATIPNRPSFKDVVRETWRCRTCEADTTWDLDDPARACSNKKCLAAFFPDLAPDGSCAVPHPGSAAFRSLKLTGSDSSEYAWFIWSRSSMGRRGQTLVLDSTPKEIRSAEVRARRRSTLIEIAKARPHVAAWVAGWLKRGGDADAAA